MSCTGRRAQSEEETAGCGMAGNGSITDSYRLVQMRREAYGSEKRTGVILHAGKIYG